MKICAVWVLLLGAVVPLFAQTHDGVPIYVPPVSGTGSAPEDNKIFTDALAIELGAWNFRVVTQPYAAEYSLEGTLSAPGASYDENAEGRFFVSFSLKKNGNTLYEQGAYYTSAENALAYIPSLLLNMLSNVFDMQAVPRPLERDDIAEPEPVDDEWRNKLWYVGAGVFWNPRLYYGASLAAHLANFGFGISAEYHFLKFMSAGTGIEMTGEYVVASPHAGDEYYNVILQIPLLIKYVWRPGEIFMHIPYAGIQFNIPLFPDTTPALVSWEAGFQFGIKAGSGVAYADLRYSMDFGKSGLNKNRPTDTRQYDRFMLYLIIGYKYDIVEPIINAIKERGDNAAARTPDEE